MSLTALDTPCIGVCSTVYGDKICRGCKRHYREIIEWNNYDAVKKQAVWYRLADNIVAVMRDVVEIIDVRRLQQQLDHFGVRYWQEQDPLCWAYYLLRMECQNIDDVSKYGIKLVNTTMAHNLQELYQALETKLLTLAQQVE